MGVRDGRVLRFAGAGLAVLPLLIGAELAVAQAPKPDYRYQPMNQPHSFREESKAAVISLEERERILNFIKSGARSDAGSAGAKSAGSNGAQNGGVPGNSPAVHVVGSGITALVLNVEFVSEASRRDFHSEGASLFAAAGPYAQIFLKPTEEAIDALVNVPGIRRIEAENPVRLPPPPVSLPGVASRGIAEQIVSGGILGLTGKGVIFAIVDTGVDFRNPDFLEMNAGGPPRTRLLYFWDAQSNAFETKGLGTRPPINYPDGRPVGTLYTRAQLNAELLLPVAQRKIPTPDENGHGTAAAGLAVGNGANSAADDKHVGVAPQADIIAVRVGDADGSMPQSFLLNAIVEWVDKAASDAHEPVVISCSFGGHDSGHDGASIEDRHLSTRFAPEVVGRAIVISAGNEREFALHAKIKAAGKDAPGVLAWNARDGATLRLLFHGGNAENFRAKDFAYDPMKMYAADPANPGASVARPTQFHKVTAATFNADTGEWSVDMIVGRGPGGVRLYSDSGQAVEGDAYFLDMPPGGSFMNRLVTPLGFQTVAFHGEQITTPGTAANAITVGSYDWNDQFDGKTKASCESAPIEIGALSCYSNPGYERRNGAGSGAPVVVKPEIVGPGQIFTTSYARATDGRPLNELLPKEKGEDYWTVEHSGRYVMFDGTSASAPYVAGIVALMMQKKPNITVGEIKKLLRVHASADAEVTGAVPNPSWGYGKLDIKAVKAVLGDLR